MNRLTRWRIRRERSGVIPFGRWRQTTALPLFKRLSAPQRARLRRLASQFLRRKAVNGVQGMRITDEIAVCIAAQACLPILNLGLDYYRDWVEIIVYPSAFRVTQQWEDDAGVVTEENRELDGESWPRGPVIIAWEENAYELAHCEHGRNVVIHEMAHKLDMLGGQANGSPPLPSELRENWRTVFNQAFAELHHGLENGLASPIDPYAASDPGEFFAVVSEYFFTAPEVLAWAYPDVYNLLCAFYRQTPLPRKPVNSSGSYSKD